ncbi:hypothetical protein O181_024332 [Austropuccinia psidii MF-1]|uniref:Uncharacterized protein n=1 Tax=Austropuccinia psidii MF-1 TaxID=1389203 RepID=A0A9Q3GYW2_9BASI|nr:hypothetical protein [Austropuccinia psidii MF-1]
MTKSFRSSFHNIINTEKLKKHHTALMETRKPNSPLPWAQPLPEAADIKHTKEEAKKLIRTQKEEEKKNKSIILFTNRSLTGNKRSGEEVYSPQHSEAIQIHLGQGDTITSYETELTSLWFAMVTARAKAPLQEQ